MPAGDGSGSAPGGTGEPPEGTPPPEPPPDDAPGSDGEAGEPEPETPEAPAPPPDEEVPGTQTEPAPGLRIVATEEIGIGTSVLDTDESEQFVPGGDSYVHLTADDPALPDPLDEFFDEMLDD